MLNKVLHKVKEITGINKFDIDYYRWYYFKKCCDINFVRY